MYCRFNLSLDNNHKLAYKFDSNKSDSRSLEPHLQSKKRRLEIKKKKYYRFYKHTNVIKFQQKISSFFFAFSAQTTANKPTNKSSAFNKFEFLIYLAKTT